MHTEYLQSVRHKLQKRIRRVKSTGFETYTSALQQLWQFLDNDEALVALQTELASRCPNADALAETIIKNGLEVPARQNSLDEPLGKEVEWAAVSMGVLRRFTSLDSRTAKKFVPQPSSTSFNDHLAAFSEFYLTPFYEYLDERLDDPQFILGRLIRFKHLCEWFWREQLFQISEDDSKHGEHRLKLRLYEFLFTEGVNFHIEPWSASGEADLVINQEGPERLAVESKIFNPAKGKSAKYIIDGFRQTYQYTADYNEAIGYLVIFNTSNKQLRFAVTGSAAPVPRVVLNHKTIFFLVIDLYPHETSASKRPQPEVVEITEAEILGEGG